MRRLHRNCDPRERRSQWREASPGGRESKGKRKELTRGVWEDQEAWMPESGASDTVHVKTLVYLNSYAKTADEFISFLPFLPSSVSPILVLPRL